MIPLPVVQLFNTDILNLSYRAVEQLFYTYYIEILHMASLYTINTPVLHVLVQKYDHSLLLLVK
jgi:hypothetical protein